MSMTENEAIEVLEKPSKHIRMVHEIKNEMQFYTFSSDLVKAFEMAIKALEELQQYRAIGTIDEFKALKENQRNCKDCAGCTDWKCDCANERDYAITQFANFLHEKAKENNGLRLSSETRSWTHPCIFDYLKEFKEKKIFEEET